MSDLFSKLAAAMSKGSTSSTITQRNAFPQPEELDLFSKIAAAMSKGSSNPRRRDLAFSSSATMDGIIALLVLIFVALLLVGVLYIVKKARTAQAIKRQQLPQYNEDGSRRSMANHRRLTITAAPYGRASSVYVYNEKSSMISSPTSAPLSPNDVPEIRITFPDEHDEKGRPQSGRVVIVRVGDNGIGLEPVKDEQLPAYCKETGDRFDSIDIERIGGLKEKSEWN